MSPEVVQRTCDYIASAEDSILTLWHCGEPLAAGLPHFRALLKPFEDPSVRSKARHLVQTNASLVNQAWCDLFCEFGFRIGVSIDGPARLNMRRVSRRGGQTYDMTMRGIRFLQRNSLAFSVIAVVGEDNLAHAGEIYAFVRDLGAEMLCINIEETEGVNKSRVDNSEMVRRFWKELYRAWASDMVMPVREFRRALNAMDSINRGNIDPWEAHRIVEMIPTVSTDGDVVLLSPEFLGIHPVGATFVIGNVLRQSLGEILERAGDAWYVRDYLQGILRCRETCSYFDLCGGGYASNKYFENKDLCSTETQFCMNRDKLLTEAILEEIEDE